MPKKTLRRFALIAAIAPALAFGAPAVSMADAYYGSESSSAGPKGAHHCEVQSKAKDGKSWYSKSCTHAGKHGAGSSSTISGAH
ncbi:MULTISPECIES: hypothetical protein [Nocardiopsidaceae]|uniref:Uncharacterized protein n=2 Tax=Nocardiopsidaceae TaxID=83676 RepID=A0ABY6YH25_9ACTN|nr:hypothetical protein [Streptomonospora nanhaiensis]MEE2043238.1 hypothetical protein [Nocardiopsis tropica]WAE71531.1 hypothetical protein OUQ99_20110 [Streptomonospora nanhaiensis]